jgi:hypothetical protein
MDENKEDLMEGMKVYVRTNSGRNYTGKYLYTDEVFVFIIDKFDQPVKISIKDIEVIEGVKE